MRKRVNVGHEFEEACSANAEAGDATGAAARTASLVWYAEAARTAAGPAKRAAGDAGDGAGGAATGAASGEAGHVAADPAKRAAGDEAARAAGDAGDGPGGAATGTASGEAGHAAIDPAKRAAGDEVARAAGDAKAAGGAARTLRERVVGFARGQLGCVVDAPFDKYPEYLAIRHPLNRKWVAALLRVPASKVGGATASGGSRGTRVAACAFAGAATAFDGGKKVQAELGAQADEVAAGSGEGAFRETGAQEDAAGDRDAVIDVMNVKLDPLLVASLRGEPGYAPAWHMNKEHWLTVRLDGSVPFDQACALLEMSYALVAPRTKCR